MSDSNHYHVLEVKTIASQGEIKEAYRRLVKRFHPDTRHENANHEKIIMINAAYEILGDPHKRRIYDQKLNSAFSEEFLHRRQQRNKQAQNHYQNCRKRQQQADIHYQQWLKQIYYPLSRLINSIIKPLEVEIESLSADPFDDELMTTFEDYLETSRQYINQAHVILTSQPNPTKLAAVAAQIYYCLNQIDDGIEELDRFTISYDDYYLHTGKELFKIAYQLYHESQLILTQIRKV